MTTQSTRISFFDLDRTLIRGNSATDWVLYEWRGGRLTRLQLLRGMAYLAAYRLGVTRMEAALRASVATLTGQREEELAARTRDFYARSVRSAFRVRAREAVAERRTAGDRVVLCTSSSPYLSALVRADLGLDDVVCTRFVVRDGRFTGEIIGAPCFGEGKREHAQSFAEAHGTRLSACSFYSDSASDLPLLTAVGEPVVVAPDPRLRRIARARGWRIHEWT